MVEFVLTAKDLLIGRLCKLCSGKTFLTAKWPLTSALDICDTRFVMVDTFFSSDMIIGRLL